jgi:hypothetical protein
MAAFPMAADFISAETMRQPRNLEQDAIPIDRILIQHDRSRNGSVSPA